MKNIKIFNKKNHLIKVLLLAIIGMGLQSCEDDDKNRLNDFSKDGAFVRFAQPFPTVIDINSLEEIANVSITATIESPDNNVVSYSMRVGATLAGTNLDSAPLGNEITSFPTTITITMADIVSALGIETSDIGFGDTFAFEGTAINEQGIVYSSERQRFDADTKTVTGGNNSADLLDEDGYRNAFEFGFAIPCPPETGDIAGEWIVEMTDTFGDGWDNAFVTFTIDGVATDYTIVGGSAATHVINVPAGTQVLVVSYTPGSFEEEHIYTVERPDGTVLGPFGPNPPLCIN